MDAATFATGISVQPPAERRRREPFFPFAWTPPSTSASVDSSPTSRAPLSPEIQRQTLSIVEAEGADDADKGNEDETYAALQEVAYHHACERSSAAVEAVIAGANVNCYRQVLEFFERHRSQPMAGSDTVPCSAPLVSFPEFRAFPAASVVSGADATSNDVWIAPLCQVLQRSFPLVLVLPPELPTARRLIEWIAEQLDAVRNRRTREEQWLVKEIDAFNMFSTEANARDDALSVTVPTERFTRRKWREMEEQRRRRRPECRASRVMGRETEGEQGAEYSSGSEYGDNPSDDSSELSSDSSSDSRRMRPAKRLRVGASSRSARSRFSSSQTSRPYAKWTIDQLLARIWDEVNALTSGSDPCESWMIVLRDMVLSPLSGMLEVEAMEGEVVVTESNRNGEAGVDGSGEAPEVSSLLAASQSIGRAIDGCRSAIRWLTDRIADCRYALAAGMPPSASRSTSNSAEPVGISTSVKMRTTEFALAQLLHEVLQMSERFATSTVEKINATISSSPASSTDREKAASTPASLLAELESWRSALAGRRKKNEAQYQLHHYHGPSSSPPKAFLLFCIEELEAFPSELLDDFLDIWTHFRQIQQSFQQETLSGSLPSSLVGFMAMGLVIGVASGASPALRRLPVSVASRLEMQFFQLDDSLKCFDDILERLVVDQKLPLALSGEALQLLAERHRTTRSIGMFLHALRYLLFSHFKFVRWSLLSHFAFSPHGARPLDALGTSVSHLSPAVAVWLARKRRRQGLPTGRVRSSSDLVASYLDLFPVRGAHVAELLAMLARSTGGDGRKTAQVAAAADWKRSVARELQHLAIRRALWATGWQCFRSACSWLDVPLAGETLLAHLALALDGKLVNGPVVHQLVQQLEYAGAAQLQPMVAHWLGLVESTLARDSSETDASDPDELRAKQAVEELRELAMVCEYAVEKQDDGETKRMLVHIRGEVRDTLLDRLVKGFVQPPRSAKRSLADVAAVRLDQSVSDRLRFSYHDKLKELLVDTAVEDEGGGEGSATWLEDVSIAFLHYQENAGVYLSLRGWFDTFADAIGRPEPARRTKAERREAQVEVKARFLRAFCTLRHWGFVRSEAASDRDAVEKLVFI